MSVVNTLAPDITRVPRYEDGTLLGGPDEHGDDFLLVVDGIEIGGTYYGCTLPAGERWVAEAYVQCAVPAARRCGYPTREAAEVALAAHYLAASR